MSSKSEVNISFIGEIPVEFKSVEQLEKTLKSFHGSDCHISIYNLKNNRDGDVSFEFYSERHNNLIWQQKLLKKYLEEKYVDKLNSYSSSVWIASGDEDLYFES